MLKLLNYVGGENMAPNARASTLSKIDRVLPLIEKMRVPNKEALKAYEEIKRLNLCFALATLDKLNRDAAEEG
jgi:hypothetical protein